MYVHQKWPPIREWPDGQTYDWQRACMLFYLYTLLLLFLLLFSHSVESDSLWCHGLQHIRLSCPSPSPRACSNSCPLSWWCHQTISSFPNTCYEATITPIPKPDKENTKKKTAVQYHWWTQMQKSSTKILANNSATHQKAHTPWSSWVYSRDARIFQYMQINHVIQHINKLKDKNHTIIWIDAEKAFDKIQSLFMIQTLQKMGIEGTYVNIVKAIYDKPTANIILNGEKLKTCPLKSGTRQGCPLSPLLFSIVLEVPATAIREEKGKKKEKKKKDTYRKRS